MNDQRHKSLIQAADFFNTTIRKAVATEQGIHAETIIASASRMAGTMIFRSFVPAPSSFAPGTSVLSEQANSEGPKLINLMFATLRQLGQSIGEDSISREPITTQLSGLTLLETQERLDPFYLAYCKARPLSFEDAAFASAITTGILIHDCREVLDTHKAAALAVYGMVEGSKTAPRSIANETKSAMSQQQTPAADKKPWYKLW